MPRQSDWDATAALAAVEAHAWQGYVFRSHDRKYGALDASGSMKIPGRYHRDWPTLYTALTKAIALGERQRHLSEHTLRRLASMRISRLHVRLSRVVDIRDPAVLGLDAEALIGDDFERTQAIGLAAVTRGIQGLLVPSATRLDIASGGNLVLFAGNVAGDTLEVTDHEDPDLYTVR